MFFFILLAGWRAGWLAEWLLWYGSLALPALRSSSSSSTGSRLAASSRRTVSFTGFGEGEAGTCSCVHVFMFRMFVCIFSSCTSFIRRIAGPPNVLAVLSHFSSYVLVLVDRFLSLTSNTFVRAICCCCWVFICCFTWILVYLYVWVASIFCQHLAVCMAQNEDDVAVQQLPVHIRMNTHASSCIVDMRGTSPTFAAFVRWNTQTHTHTRTHIHTHNIESKWRTKKSIVREKTASCKVLEDNNRVQ